jgi:transcriptional regulator with XRE-family HTH domain
MGEYASVDDYLATNVRHWREAQKLSQDELAKRMAERGFGFSQATIWKIEQGRRPVKVSEAAALADALDLRSWNSLTAEPERTRHDARVQTAHRRAARTYDAVKAAAVEFLEAQDAVAVLAHEAREEGVPVAELWTSWLTVPLERAVIEARVEYSQEDAIREQLNHAVDQILAALRVGGYEAIIDLDAIQVVPAGRTPAAAEQHEQPDCARPTQRHRPEHRSGPLTPASRPSPR